MKQFGMYQLYEAITFALGGGQSLHLHSFSLGHPLFRRYKTIAHLFDQDKTRLITTAQRLGVKIIKVEHESETRQHIDLCGKPLEKALKEAEKS